MKFLAGETPSNYRSSGDELIEQLASEPPDINSDRMAAAGRIMFFELPKRK